MDPDRRKLERLRPTKDNFLLTLLALASLPFIISTWFSAVSSHVAEPYLDEVFHVRQAQKYCEGKFSEWDPKITTPPGLYFLSHLVNQVSGFCGLSALRLLNAVLLFCTFLVLLHMSSPTVSRTIASQRSPRATSLLPFVTTACPQQVHTALNCCLFPPLFFFCGLYYTDIGSTLFVLLFFKHFSDIHSKGPPTIFQSFCSILLGLAALTFRQTNIFWVAVFPAGLLVYGTLPDKREWVKEKIDRSLSLKRWLQVMIHKSWTCGIVYDPQVRGAWANDYFLSLVSVAMLAIRALKKPSKTLLLVRVLLPYAIILACFAAFVLWNGGVVLGDKSNHIATLHMPQMLYLWPYITFFSIPLTYPFLLQGGLALLAMLPVVVLFEPMLVFSRGKIIPRPVVTLIFVAIATAIVRTNTIVHPFTLADNRHYMFYIFRVLFRHPTFKYLATAIYLICSWSVIQTMGAPAKILFTAEDQTMDVDQPGENFGKDALPASKQLVHLNDASLGEGCTVSYVVVWLATSTLSLVTAPLVEPRYFILPWLMWRLRVPLLHPGALELHPNQVLAQKLERQNTAVKSLTSRLVDLLWIKHDHRLWLESFWLLSINAVTGWIFLKKGFTWPQEPGNAQRFMW